MALFTPPIYKPSLQSAQGTIRDKHPASSSKKRKRDQSTTSSPSPPSSSEEDEDDDDADTRSLYAASTNPLSLAPDEIVQYRLAGLDLDEVLPSQRVKGFPHRGLPGHVMFHERVRKVRSKSKGKGKGKERARASDEDENENEDEEEQVDIFKQSEDELDDEAWDKTMPMWQGKKRQERGPRLRRHHLGVLTTVLHRCLAEGDLERAGRAWALLLRAEIGGLPIDIRNTGYWGIGAELLIRGQESKPPSRGRRDSLTYDAENDKPDDDSEAVEGLESDSRSGSRFAPKRWGTAEGLEKAKEYYERLILQYPYVRQFPNAVTAVDFWPAMFGCEIYGIRFKQKEELWNISREEETDENNDNENEELYSEDEEGDEDEDEDGGYSFQEKRQSRRRARMVEKRWQQREAVRRTTLEASVALASKMDELMTSLPYSDSHVLLRLRGMLALYIGDLSVPTPLSPDDIDDEQMPSRTRQLGIENDGESRLLRRQREAEHQRGLRNQEEERERARALFEKIVYEGGDIGRDIQDIVSQRDPSEDIYDADY
ncbi:hypothetical protein B7463_g738, partial [Scytalidium lignicola]